MIDIGENKIHGNIPPQLGHLSSLEGLYLGSNALSGEVPVIIFNISSLKVIALAANTLSGKLPSNLGYSLPNLEGLYLGINNFSGKLPSSISNATKLKFLDLGRNMFSGNVPIDLGINLQQFQSINFQRNMLTNDPSSTGEINFLSSFSHCKYLKFLMIGDNQFNGILPKSSLTNMSLSLERFIAFYCGIRGEIPVEIGNWTNLSWLTLGANEFIGSIPQELGNLKKLQTLRLYENKLDGIIPERLCEIKELYYFDLRRNQITGQVLGCLGNISSLRYIYFDSNNLSSSIPLNFWSNKDISVVSLSFNQLNGPLAPEIANMGGLSELYLSRNELYGSIPSTILQLQKLVILALDMNRLDSTIPKSFEKMVSLEYLDLSQNNLTDQIPESLTKLEHLNYLNVSYNELSGEIPDGGPFGNFTAESFIGNAELCGPPRFQVKVCEVQNNVTRRNRKKTVLKFVLGPIAAGGLVMGVLGMIWLLNYRKRNNQLIPLTDWYDQLSHKRFSYYELVRGTNNFDESNLIGKGSLGMVYKGTFTNGTTAAVKVFNAQVQDAFKRFDLECKVLRNIQHRNLVKRLKIMFDVACAVEYLHQGHSLVVVHCDLKPSNILLDGNMVARVSDFGISKLLTAYDPVALTKTLGTIGYMAPEYGSEGIVSTMGDVYSYGILLMETFTRKKPVDDEFVGDLTLKRWVAESYPHRVMDIVDANLFSTDDSEQHLIAIESCLRSVLDVALECTADFPQERITMNNVRVRLNKIQTQFLAQ
ncbi:receptor kinase-like protein Xa21 [Solanum stenotomum]|uniref:receptor kinase-like protein Xa21 n=1 Tax=Solanum stenotomum TaxID=172797 RepID=UPI0020D1DB94|nr:receptor kinase-like protein Xa21 [Solanum stenotomum]